MSNNVQILVVDDDVLVRSVTLRRLASLGYRTLEASSGSEALGLLSKGAAVDLLLTDVMMPGDVNGVELARHAQRLQPAIKVLFASGHSDEAVLQDQAGGNAVHLIVKPYSKAELADKIREVLGSRPGLH